MISVHFQGKPFNITVIQVYAPTSNAEEADVEWFYEDLHDLLELAPQKYVLFIIGDWNAKSRKSRNTWSNRKIWPWSTEWSRAKANRVLPREGIRLKLKKVGKTTKPFRYDLNQIPYDYAMEVTNRFKGLDLIECLKNYGWRFMTLNRKQWSRPSPRKRNAKR